MITTNVTHGRPYRLPLADETSRLFYKPTELGEYFQAVVLDALLAASQPYAPRSSLTRSRSEKRRSSSANCLVPIFQWSLARA